MLTYFILYQIITRRDEETIQSRVFVENEAERKKVILQVAVNFDGGVATTINDH